MPTFGLVIAVEQLSLYANDQWKRCSSWIPGADDADQCRAEYRDRAPKRTRGVKIDYGNDRRIAGAV